MPANLFFVQMQRHRMRGCNRCGFRGKQKSSVPIPRTSCFSNRTFAPRGWKMNPILVLLVALGIGFVCGLRAFAPLALVSWLANWGWTPLAGSHLAFLGTTAGAVIVSIIAVVELIGDKLPKTPKRTESGPLAARMLTGTMCAVAVFAAAGQSLVLGIICGVIGGIDGTFAG